VRVEGKRLPPNWPQTVTYRQSSCCLGVFLVCASRFSFSGVVATCYVCVLLSCGLFYSVARPNPYAYVLSSQGPGQGVIINTEFA
jgi:hypothetical protein